MSGVSSQASGNRYRRAFQGSCEGALQHWRVFVALAVLGITGLSAYEFVAGEAGWIKTQTIQAETQRLLAENTDLGRQVKDLQEQERHLSDDAVVEKLVREKLRLSHPGEILYIFEENPANSSSIDGVVVAKRPPKKEEEEEEETRH